MTATKLAQDLKDFLKKDEIKIVCPCIKCIVMIPMNIDEYTEKLEAAGVDYNNWKQLRKWSHNFIQTSN
jgi:hypothetical protein